jgi:hypothetical protein
MGLADNITKANSEWKEIDAEIRHNKQKEAILLELRMIALLSRKSQMPQLSDEHYAAAIKAKHLLCKTPNCGKPSAPHLKIGLCIICHSKAKKLVESGQTTWEELGTMGLVVATSNDPFTTAFNQKKGK